MHTNKAMQVAHKEQQKYYRKEGLDMHTERDVIQYWLNKFIAG